MKVRGRQAPQAARARLDGAERVLAWAGADDAVVVASNLGLWWPDTSGARRIDWHLVTKATWADGVLRVVAADVVDDLLLVDQPALTLRLGEPESPAGTASAAGSTTWRGNPVKLAKIVRQRVEGSVAQSQLVRLDGGVDDAALIVARKVSGADGWSWWARLQPGTADTGDVREQVSLMIERRRAEQRARQANL